MTFPGFIPQHRMAGGEWRLGMRLCGGTKSSCNIIAGVSGEWSLGMRLCNGTRSPNVLWQVYVCMCGEWSLGIRPCNGTRS